MDLKNLISKNDNDQSVSDKEPVQTPTQTPPSLIPKPTSETRLSIHNLMNDYTNNGTNDNAKDNNNSTPTSVSQEKSQASSDEQSIKKRNSISNLTNEDDIDMTGNKTPNMIRGNSSSSSTNPVETLKIKDENGPVETKPPNKPVSVPLHDQIKKLEDLKNKEDVEVSIEGKPKRYRSKPTWARDYVPTINRAVGNKGGGFPYVIKDSITNATKLSIPSITGSIPRNDFNKLITEWIWANIEGVKQDYSDVPNVEEYIELELKVGNIWDKVKDRRLQLPINTECIISTDFYNQECYFKSGITLQKYNDIKAYLNKLSQDVVTQKGKNNKFIIENSHVVDLIATDARRNDKPASGRVTLDIKTKRKMASIQKQRIADLFIYMPNTLFDLRLSMSLELPNELNDEAFEFFKKRITLEREKDRISFIHQATFTRLDLTKVKENKVNNYELELEINNIELLRSMKRVMDDPLYYIDLVQAFLDNGRIITRQLSVQH